MAYLENNITVGKNQSRKLVLLDDSSHLQSNEEQCDIVMEENSTLELYRIQNLNDDSKLTTHINIKQAANSSVHFVIVTFNTGFVQNNINVDLNGEGADLQIYGLYILDKKQHVENLMKINHNVPNCSSNEKFKGTLKSDSNNEKMGWASFAYNKGEMRDGARYRSRSGIVGYDLKLTENKVLGLRDHPL